MLVATPVLSTHQLPEVLSGDETTQAFAGVRGPVAQVGVTPAEPVSEFIWLVIVGSAKTLPAVLQAVPAVPKLCELLS